MIEITSADNWVSRHPSRGCHHGIKGTEDPARSSGACLSRDQSCRQVMSAWKSLQNLNLFPHNSLLTQESHGRHRKTSIYVYFLSQQLLLIRDGNNCMMWKTEYMQWSVDISSNWGFSLNNFGSCGNWMEPEGRNSGNTFMNFRNGQHPNISNKGFMIVQLLFPELLFSWHFGWFLLLNIHLSMY